MREVGHAPTDIDSGTLTTAPTAREDIVASNLVVPLVAWGSHTITAATNVVTTMVLPFGDTAEDRTTPATLACLIPTVTAADASFLPDASGRATVADVSVVAEVSVDTIPSDITISDHSVGFIDNLSTFFS
jgi:hypothetical protein